MTTPEYRANLNGMNIFFGAVLGFVMAGVENMPKLHFSVMLMMTSGIVIGILYVTSSRHRLAYLALTAGLIFELPRTMKFLFVQEQFPPNLQPTLAVWLLMTALVEFAPREAEDTPALPEP